MRALLGGVLRRRDAFKRAEDDGKGTSFLEKVEAKAYSMKGEMSREEGHRRLRGRRHTQQKNATAETFMARDQ